MAIPLLACMVAVSAALNLPPRVLPSIQAVEGGNNGLVRMNVNGSEDLGLMQVNSVWLSALTRDTGLSRESVRDKLVHDGCFSIAAAGAIIRFHLRESRGDLLAAVGNYHSRTLLRHKIYINRVIGAAIRMFERLPPGPQKPAKRANRASRSSATLSSDASKDICAANC